MPGWMPVKLAKQILKQYSIQKFLFYKQLTHISFARKLILLLEN